MLRYPKADIVTQNLFGVVEEPQSLSDSQQHFQPFVEKRQTNGWRVASPPDIFSRMSLLSFKGNYDIRDAIKS